MKLVAGLVLVALALAVSAADPLPSNSVASSGGDADWVTPEIVANPKNKEEDDMNEKEPQFVEMTEEYRAPYGYPAASNPAFFPYYYYRPSPPAQYLDYMRYAAAPPAAVAPPPMPAYMPYPPYPFSAFPPVPPAMPTYLPPPPYIPLK